MNRSARDPAEAGAQILALAATVAFAAFFVVSKIAPPRGSGAHVVDTVQLSVVAPPRDEPKPQPQAPKRTPLPVRHQHLTQPAHPRRMPATATPQPATVPEAPPARPEETAAPAPPDPPVAPPSAGPADPNLAYEVALKANISARTCGPDTPEYRLLQPTGLARVRFTVDRGGAVSGVRIAASSGSTILDRQAYAIVSNGQYQPMPASVFAGESSHVFLVEIEFRRGGGCAS